MSAARARRVDGVAAGRASVLRLDGRAVDIRVRALVIGQLDATPGPAETLVERARRHIEAGADAVEVRAGQGTGLAAAVRALRSRVEVPVGVAVDDAQQMRDAFDAGAMLMRLTETPAREVLGVAAISGSTIVITDHAGDAIRLAATCGLGADRVVVQLGADGVGDAAIASALQAIPAAAQRGCALAWCGDDPVSIACAVELGARLVYTRAVATAAHIVRTLAAIEEAAS